MDKTDLERIVTFYEDALKKYGPDDPRSLHWVSTYNQLRRFQILLQVGNLRGKRVLDVGCGLGDLYGYMQANSINCDYTGIDIVPDLIDGATKKYPGMPFFVRDIFDVQERYDVVLASGSLTFKVKDYENYYKKMIRKMYDIATEAVAFNMLDKEDGAADDDPEYATYSPAEMSDHCKSFCDDVQVTVGYLPGDFSVFLRKE